MNSTAVIDDKGTYHGYAGGVILSATNVLASTKPAGKIKTTPSESEDPQKGNEYVLWGESDDTPNNLKTEAQENTVLTAGMRLMAKLNYGGGLSYGNIVVKDGKRNWDYAYEPQIQKWLRETNFPRHLFTLFYDIGQSGNAYLLFTKSQDGKSIARVTSEHTRPVFVRLDRVNKQGEHAKAFVNPDFGTSYLKPENTVTYPVCPTYDAAYWVKTAVKDGGSFILPQKLVDAGSQVYSTPDWNSARTSNWSSIAKSIALLNKAMLENSMRPLWHIEVHADFWPAYKGKEVWETLKNDPKKRQATIEEFHNALSDKLMGAANAGCYIATPLAHEAGIPEKAFGLVKITPLENKLLQGKDGFYLTTSREASQHLVVSMGLDSAMMGTIPGDGGMGAGSGSNNRVAFNQRVLLAKADQDMFLNFMYMVAEVNGWPDYEWLIDQGLITTLDAGAEATTPTPAPAEKPKDVNGSE